MNAPRDRAYDGDVGSRGTAAAIVASAAVCAPAVADTYVDSPLTSSGSADWEQGGSYGSDGWTTSAVDDFLVWEIPTSSEGGVEFSITGMSLDSTLVGGDFEILTMYEDGYGLGEPIGYAPYFRSNDYKVFVRIYGTLDDVSPGGIKLLLLVCPQGDPGYHETCDCPTQFLQEDRADQTWDAATPYRFRLEWSDGTMTLSLDGVEMQSYDSSLTYAPAVQHVRLGSPRNDGGLASMPVGVTFSDIVVEGTPAPPAPGCFEVVPGEMPPAPDPPAGEPFAIDPDDPARFVHGGEPFFFAGESAFALATQSEADWTAFLDQSEAEGFSQLRIILLAPGLAAQPWPLGGTPDAPDFSTWNAGYVENLDAILLDMAGRGMVAELVLWGGYDLGWLPSPTAFDGLKQAYVAAVAGRWGAFPNVYFEVANEYDHASDGPYPHDGLPPEFSAQVAAAIEKAAPGRLVTISSQGSDAPPLPDAEWNDLLDYHLPRVTEWWPAPWTIFPPNEAFGRPQVSDEPTKSATDEEIVTYYAGSASVDGDAAHFRHAMWIASLSRGHFTLHSHKGLSGEAGPSPGREFVRPWREFWEWAGDRLVGPDGGILADCEALACYAARRGDGSLTVAYFVGATSGATVRLAVLPEDDLSVVFVDPKNGERIDGGTVRGPEADLALPAIEPDVGVALFLGEPPGEGADGGAAEGEGEGDGGAGGAGADESIGGGCGCAVGARP